MFRTIHAFASTLAVICALTSQASCQTVAVHFQITSSPSQTTGTITYDVTTGCATLSDGSTSTQGYIRVVSAGGNTWTQAYFPFSPTCNPVYPDAGIMFDLSVVPYPPSAPPVPICPGCPVWLFQAGPYQFSAPPQAGVPFTLSTVSFWGAYY